MADLSVIIVNHNTKQLCAQTVSSIWKAAEAIKVEVIVVDNSTKSEERFAPEDDGVIVVGGIENKGFGFACNVGAGRASADRLLFLNPDTILDNHALDKSYGYMAANPETGALGIRTSLQNGEFDHGCKRGFPTPFNSFCYFLKLDKLFRGSRLVGGYRMTYLPDNVTNEVDSVSGAFLMVPRKLFFDLGGFDEAFFMYGEDLDLCYRIKQAGFSVVYFAGASMIHLKGQSGLHTDNPAVLRYFYDSMRIFYDKHYRKKYNFFITWMVHFAIQARYRLSMKALGTGGGRLHG